MKKQTSKIETPELTICIPTTPSRQCYLDDLLSRLNEQVKGKPVELLINDDPDKTAGRKRNELYAKAKGQYICGFDDDDLPAACYVDELLAAIASFHPDAVGFHAQFYEEGEMQELCQYSNTYEVYGHLSNGDYTRPIGHINPVKASIAKAVEFPDSNIGEARQWSYAIKPYIKGEAFIDLVLYNYFYRRDKNRLPNEVEALERRMI